MDPFPPDDPLLPQNGNGKSANGSGRNGLANNGSYRAERADKLPSRVPAFSNDGLGENRPGKDGPELIPVYEDQGERFDKARRSALKVYIVLVVTGVIIGGISLFGIVLLMQHFGLTDVPVPVEQK